MLNQYCAFLLYRISGVCSQISLSAIQAKIWIASSPSPLISKPVAPQKPLIS